MKVCKVSFIVLLVACLASVASADWAASAGMNFSYGDHPTSPTHVWGWGGADNGDGTWTYGSDTFPSPGLHYGVLAVDNSIDSYDAYISNYFALTTPVAAGGGQGQQFLYSLPGGTGGTGYWAVLIYNGGQAVQHWEQTGDGSAWLTTYVTIDSLQSGAAYTLTDIEIRIGILRDAGTTTGIRTMCVDDAVTHGWSIGNQEFENFAFETIPEPATMALLGLGGLLHRRKK